MRLKPRQQEGHRVIIVFDVSAAVAAAAYVPQLQICMQPKLQLIEVRGA